MVTWTQINREFDLSPAAILALKVGACVAMVLDHIDWLLFDSSLFFHDTLGRAVFPVFAFILARNLARAEPAHMLRSVVPRMVAVGVVAQLAYGALVDWSGPLNVMFSLALAVSVVSWWNAGRYVAALVAFVLFGAVVDYLWFGVAMIAVFTWLQGREGIPAWFYGVGAALFLYPVNGGAWAVLLAPLLLLAGRLDGPAARYKWLFYAFYPLHLYILAAVDWSSGVA